MNVTKGSRQFVFGKPIDTFSSSTTLEELSFAVRYDNFRPPRKYPPVIFFPNELERTTHEQFMGLIGFFYTYYWICFPISAVYVVFIAFLERWMKKRQKYSLKYPLALWYSMLACGSTIGAFRAVPVAIVDFIYEDTVANFCYMSISCKNCEYLRSWTFLFSISKVFHLGDTVFLILRKRWIIFFHWFHHVVMLCLTFYGQAGMFPAGLYYLAMNISIHSIMYTHYAVCVLGYKVPRPIRLIVPVLEIFQFVFGLSINITTYVYEYRMGPACVSDLRFQIYVSLTYASFFALHMAVFCKVHVKKQKAAKILSLQSVAKFIETLFCCSCQSEERQESEDAAVAEMQPIRNGG